MRTWTLPLYSIQSVTFSMPVAHEKAGRNGKAPFNLTTKGLGLKEHRIPDYSKRIRVAVLYSCSVAIADPD